MNVRLTFYVTVSYTVIFPFINQMVEELQVTDNPDRVGFYSGLVVSLRGQTQLLRREAGARQSHFVLGISFRLCPIFYGISLGAVVRVGFHLC